MNYLTLLASSILIAATGLAQTNTAYVTMVDPREQAFSLDVPQGWKAYGGMFRSNGFETHPFVDMTSPDGMINLRIGDASIPTYDLPAPQLQALQSRYRQPGQQNKIIAPYASGDQFATRYGQSRFGSMCQSLQTVKSGQGEPTLGRGTPGTRITAGWAGFTCTKDGRQMGAYVYSETLDVLPTFGSSGKWYVVVLGSAIATTERGKEAGEILLHSYKSVALNPVWQQKEAALIRELTALVQAGSRWSTEQFNASLASYQKSMRMQAQQSANFNDIQNGQTYAMGANGQTYVVPTGSGGTQWIDPLNNVKESPLVPGPGYTQLTPISR